MLEIYSKVYMLDNIKKLIGEYIYENCSNCTYETQ